MFTKKNIYPWYVLAIFTLAYMVSFIDRQVLSLLIEPIKQDLNISDTQVSLLIGFAFSIFYVTMAIPIARMADKRNRVNIIAIGIFFWSLMTALCGFTKNYWQLFVTRVGVGVGEASLTPSVYSLIPDYFPREKLGKAVGIYMMGMSLGSGLALILGGIILKLLSGVEEINLPLIGSLKPWQLTFLIVGLPGILLALIVKLSIKEPLRKNVFETQDKNASNEKILSFLKNNKKTLASIVVAYSFGGMAFFAFLSWIPEHLRRTFDWDISNAGLVFGSLLATIGSIGAVSGGKFHDLIYKKGYKDAPLRCAMIVFLILFPVMAITPIIPNSNITVVMLGVFSFVLFFQQAMSPIAIQMITPNHLRAQVVAIYFFVATFFSIGIGPSIVAIFTDFLFQDESKLNLSISLTSLICLPVSILSLYLGLKPYKRSYLKVRN